MVNGNSEKNRESTLKFLAKKRFRVERKLEAVSAFGAESAPSTSVPLRSLIHMFKLHQQESYFKTFLLQITMLVVYIAVVFQIFDSESCYFQNDIVSQHVMHASFTSTGDTREFEDVNDFPSFWEWFEGPCMENIYPAMDRDDDRGSLLYNKYFHMMGAFQIRQVRVMNTTKSYGNQEYAIWPEYTKEVEDQRAAAEIWSPGIAAHVQHPRWNSSLSDLPELTGNPRFKKAKQYGKGGYIVELDSNYTKTKDIIKQLKDNHFLDQGNTSH